MRHHIQKWRDESEFGVMASLNWEKIVLLTESGVCWAIRWERQLGSGPLAWGSGSQQATLPWGIWQYLEALLVMIVASSG